MRTTPRGEDRNERGFSLIELMVVVLIIAILIAIAIPTLNGARQRANDRATQANVRNAFTATRVWYTDKQSYTDVPSEMATVEPSINWTTSALDGSSPSRAVGITVYDVPGPAQTVVVVARTRTGRCYYLRDVMGGATAGTYYEADVSGAVSCPALDPATITKTSWN
jgi:type IV pilus assembly protein PilA